MRQVRWIIDRVFRFCLSTVFFCLGLILLAQVGPRVEAKDEAPVRFSRRSILIVAEGISWHDLSNEEALPNLYHAVKCGGSGLLNVRSADRSGRVGSYVSLGASTRSTGYPGGQFGYEPQEPYSFPWENGERAVGVIKTEPAGVVFSRRTGYAVPPGGAVQMAVTALRRANRESDYGALVGLLGERVKSVGLKAAVIGNSDTFRPRRPAVAIAMDRQGVVPVAAVGNDVLQFASGLPFGRKLDPTAMWDAFLAAWEQAALIVVEWGDCFRAGRFAAFAGEEAAKLARERALQDLDSLVGRIVRLMGAEDQLILCSLATEVEQYRSDAELAPVLVFQKGQQAGLLTSPSTRRRGLITLVDIPVTIGSHLGLDTSSFAGEPACVIAAADPLTFLLRKKEEIQTVEQWRAPVLKGYVVVQVLLLLSVAAAILWWNCPDRWKRALSVGLLWSMAVPAGFLVISLVPLAVYWQVAILFTGALILAWVLNWIRPPGGRLVVLAASTVVLICADLALGAPLMSRSFLGYSPVIGARFYGIGNEYAGILIGAAVMLAAILTELFAPPGKYLAAFLLPVVLAFLALPGLGANFGGTLTAAVAFSVLLVRLYDLKLSRRRLLAAGAVLLVLAATYVGLVAGSAGSSHIGDAVNKALRGQWGELWRIAVRKVDMNLTLVRYTIWTRVLLAAVAAWGVVLWQGERHGGGFSRLYPVISRAMLAVWTAAVIAFFSNDSGVVATATTLIFGLQVPIFLVLIGKELSD